MAATPQPSHPEHLESFGTHCSLPHCNISDFLPFKCPYCALSFCGDHRLPSSHQCTSPLSSSRERTATLCPLCGEVLPIAELLARPSPSPSNVGGEADPGENVDRAMELHLDSGRCTAMQTDSKGILLSPEEQRKKLQEVKRKQGSNVCAYNRCRNRMWIDLKCKECGKGFCPSHREEKAHRCTAAGSSGNNSSGGAKLSPVDQRAFPSSSTATANKGTSKGVASSDSGGTAAAGAGKTGGLFGKLKTSTHTQSTGVNKSQAASGSTGAASPSTRQPSSASATAPEKLAALAKPEIQSPSSGGNDLSQSLVGQPGILGKLNQTSEERAISKRAAAEQQAALLSLRHRAEKGLLNDDGKIKLATLEAELGKKNGRLPSSLKIGNSATSAGGAAKKGENKKKDCCIS